MIICQCNVLTDHAVKGCLKPGPDCPRSPAQVYRCLGCSPQCGRCATAIRALMDQTLPTVHAGCSARCGAACPQAKSHIGADAPSSRPSAGSDAAQRSIGP